MKILNQRRGKVSFLKKILFLALILAPIYSGYCGGILIASNPVWLGYTLIAVVVFIVIPIIARVPNKLLFLGEYEYPLWQIYFTTAFFVSMALNFFK